MLLNYNKRCHSKDLTGCKEIVLLDLLKMVDLRMTVTKTRPQVNGLVKYNRSTEGNLSRRFNEKQILGMSIP